MNVTKLARMAHEFAEEYHNGPLVDISFDVINKIKSVHLRADTFKKDLGDLQVYTKKRDCDTYFFEHSVMFDGVKFFCISDKEVL